MTKKRLVGRGLSCWIPTKRELEAMEKRESACARARAKLKKAGWEDLMNLFEDNGMGDEVDAWNYIKKKLK